MDTPKTEFDAQKQPKWTGSWSFTTQQFGVATGAGAAMQSLSIFHAGSDGLRHGVSSSICYSYSGDMWGYYIVVGT